MANVGVIPWPVQLTTSTKNRENAIEALVSTGPTSFTEGNVIQVLEKEFFTIDFLDLHEMVELN